MLIEKYLHDNSCRLNISINYFERFDGYDSYYGDKEIKKKYFLGFSISEDDRTENYFIQYYTLEDNSDVLVSFRKVVPPSLLKPCELVEGVDVYKEILINIRGEYETLKKFARSIIIQMIN